MLSPSLNPHAEHHLLSGLDRSMGVAGGIMLSRASWSCVELWLVGACVLTKQDLTHWPQRFH